MLAQDYRFQLANDSGGQITSVLVDVQRHKFDSSNELVYDGTSMDTMIDTDTTSGTPQNSVVQQNEDDKYIGFTGHIEFTANDTTADGPVVLRLQFSHDGGDSPIWPEDGTGIVLASFHLDTAEAVHSTSFEF